MGETVEDLSHGECIEPGQSDTNDDDSERP